MTNQFPIIFQKDKLGIGKRKQAIARVFLIPGTGNITINKVSGEKYLQYNTTYLTNIMLPLKLLNLEKQFDIFVLVNGGGLTGQAEAIRLGVARLLCKIEQQNRPLKHNQNGVSSLLGKSLVRVSSSHGD